MKKISDEYFTLNENQLKEINESADKISKMIQDKEIDEGILGGIIGGLTGVTIGPAIGRAICKALGIQSGMLYNLLTSRAFTTMVSSYIGYKQ